MILRDWRNQAKKNQTKLKSPKNQKPKTKTKTKPKQRNKAKKTYKQTNKIF